MRVISQNGYFDLPYENTAIFVVGNRVIACCGEDDYALAEYSNKEKAAKAMEMLRYAYVSMPIVMQNVDVSEDVVKEFEKLKKCGVMIRADNQPSKVEFINNYIFQFPQDDEIEVVE